MGDGEEVGELCDQGSGREPEDAEKKFGWMNGAGAAAVVAAAEEAAALDW